MTNFLEKWSTKKAEKPKAGTRSAVDAFRARVTEQKAYLEEFELDAVGFDKWRSTWFQRVPGGFGVSIGRDAIDAGEGLSYVVVQTAKEVTEFLDDLLLHADQDKGFQQALEDNRQRRAALLNSAKSKATAETTDASKPKRGRKTKA